MILLDINVLLDVLQRREPHYTASARVINAVVRKRIEGVLSAHAITTLDYLVTRHSGAQKIPGSCRLAAEPFHHRRDRAA